MKRIYTLSKTMAFLFSCMALIGTVLCLRMHVEHPVISVNPLD